MAIAVLLHLYLQLLYGRQAAGSRQQAAGSSLSPSPKYSA